MIEKWLQTDLHPNCQRTVVLLLLLKSHEDLGLLPTLENAETLESASTHQTQKSPESFSQIADPLKNTSLGIYAIPQGSALPLKRTLQNTASNSTKNLQWARAGPLLNLKA